jgi:hypothetical protein
MVNIRISFFWQGKYHVGIDQKYNIDASLKARDGYLKNLKSKLHLFITFLVTT